MSPTRDREANSGDELAALPERPIALRYAGQGAALPGVPARDLYEDEIGEVLQRLAAESEAGATEERPALTPADVRKQLLASGLYERAGK